MTRLPIVRGRPSPTSAGSGPLNTCAETNACFHCAEPVLQTGRWPITYDGSIHQTCCAGCQAVASTILESGLAQFYRQRPDEALRQTTPLIEQAPDSERFTVYDSEAMLRALCA